MREYREADALNYSTLAALDSNNPGVVFKEDRDREYSLAMTKGSLVDCLLFTPDEYDNQFIIKEEATVSPAIKILIDNLLDMNLEYNDTNLLFVASENKFGGTNWSDETILKRIKTDDSREYFEQKKLNTKKLIISQEIYDQAANVIEVLKNHEFTSYIFNSDNEVLFQVPVYWDEIIINPATNKNVTVKCKALLDIVILDHKNKLLIPIDLKIKSDSKYAFPQSFLRFKYYLQAAWYSRALLRTKSYKIVNFSFLVTSFDYPDPPLIYQCSNETMTIGNYGGEIGNRRVQGIFKLMQDYIWYKETGNINYSRDIYENKGVINI